MSTEHLCLKWNNFEYNIASFLDILRNENDFVDVTITCGEKNFKAHKVILSACSPYFRGIFQENPCSHPVIILKNVTSHEMDAILQYIYTGETYITKDELVSFLSTASLLQIIGLINYQVYNPDQTPHNGTFGSRVNEFVNKNRLGGNVTSNSNVSNTNPSYTTSTSSSTTTTTTSSTTTTTTSTTTINNIPNTSSNKASNIVVKKFASKVDDPPPPAKKPNIEGTSKSKKAPPPPTNMDGEHRSNDPKNKTGDACPILSKQLLLPKKRKMSVIDQNKNEFYENPELSTSSEDIRENGAILRNCLEEKAETEGETDEDSFPVPIEIKKEEMETENVLEPEVGLCVKEESEFESMSEESLHNGDILLQRLQAYQGEGHSDHPMGEEISKVPKPDVSIFSKKSARVEGENENLTLTPNVEIFLRNANNSTDNLIHKLTRINLFKAKQFKKLSKKQLLLKPEVVAGTSKCEKDSGAVKNGIGSDGKGFHLTNLPCPHCRQVYNNLSALKYHVRLMHSDLENKLFCHLCPMNFIEREYFKIHLWEAHNARF